MTIKEGTAHLLNAWKHNHQIPWNFKINFHFMLEANEVSSSSIIESKALAFMSNEIMIHMCTQWYYVAYIHLTHYDWAIFKYVIHMSRAIYLKFESRSFTCNIASAICLYPQRVLIRNTNEALIRIIYQCTCCFRYISVFQYLSQQL